MARGTSRAPSQNAYRGSIGRTQTTMVHVTGPRGDLIAAQVYTTIDAVSDPELVDRLHSEDPSRALNVVHAEGNEPVRVTVPVVYHDPAAELMVLVLADAYRHTELDERIRLLQRLKADEAPIPAYAKEFAVVYGSAGLRAYLERRAQEALEAARTAEVGREVDRRRADVMSREAELDRLKGESDKRARDIERRGNELEAARGDLERNRQELERTRIEIERLKSEARNLVIAAARQPAPEPAALAPAPTHEPAMLASAPAPEPAELVGERTAIGPAPTAQDEGLTRPVELSELDEIETSLQNVALASAEPAPRRADSEGFESASTGVTDVEKLQTAAASAVNGHAAPSPAPLEFDEETTGSAIVPQGSDPLTTETKELPLDVVTDGWLDKAAARDSSSLYADPLVGVRLALVAGEQLARGLGGMLDVRVLLHRTRAYPLVTLVIGPPAALRVTSTTQLAVIPLDIAVDQHRAVLTALSRRFELITDVVVRNRAIRRVRLTAPLADNVGYILRAADDHLRALTSSGEGVPSFDAARDLVAGAGFDLLGADHQDAGEFRDDKLAQLETAQHLRRAIAMARRFARPSREDYLVCTRGFPLPRWRELRRHVLESAVAWGLWMGPELAQVAVSEGLARSRRDLVVRLDHGFEKLKRHASAFDIDEEAAEDNYKALSEEARALGVELTRSGKGGQTFTSEEVSSISGAIGGTPPKGTPKPKTTDELIAELDDRALRVSAAIALCDRAEARAAAPVIASVGKLSRAEAVRVLGMSVKFGDAATRPLMEGLASSKGFLRHGCALALALLRTEDGTQAVIDLLLNEPTEIWREVARAIGQVGPTGLMPLASNYGRLGDRATPQHSERVAWAMAHIAVRGGKAAVETMAGGASVVAPVARHALELHASAAKDQTSVRPGANGSQAGRDVTVNRAFSRRFFEALEQGLPDAAQAGLDDLDASSPMELLDESDLIDDEEIDEAELDESDLIST
ncbi:MAG: hypothetical protein IPQ07_03915 [Myxococcales bacterium]|nr:hypothetical protein [Myxococcales bacterium]